MWKLHFRRIAAVSTLLVLLIVVFSGVQFLTSLQNLVSTRDFVNTAHQWYRGANSILGYKLFIEQRKKEDSIMRVELKRWSPPDLHPTPWQWRRGTPQDTFGNSGLLTAGGSVLQWQMYFALDKQR